MSVRDTSREAYDGVNLNAGQQKVLAAIDKYTKTDWSRSELSHASGIPINVICPRVFELIEKGVLMEMPVRKCGRSGRQCHPVARVPVQARLVA